MTSLTPVAMPTADRESEREREVEGGGREWEEVEGGGEAEPGLNSLLTLPGQGDRQASGGYQKEQNAVEFPGAGGGGGRIGGVVTKEEAWWKPVFTFLTLPFQTLGCPAVTVPLSWHSQRAVRPLGKQKRILS